MKYYKFEVFIPQESSKILIRALNDRGLLRDGSYDYCYSKTSVKGNFRPLKGANPYIGEVGKIEEVCEDKLEFRIREKDKELALKIIKENHPYEVPVINIIQLLDL